LPALPESRPRQEGTSANAPYVEKVVDTGETYSLRNCQGFRVERDGKKLGVVDDVLFGRQSEPATLLVRTGLFRLGLHAISVHEVETVDPRALLITLRAKVSANS
jgi:hypothetical protein